MPPHARQRASFVRCISGIPQCSCEGPVFPGGAGPLPSCFVAISTALWCHQTSPWARQPSLFAGTVFLLGLVAVPQPDGRKTIRPGPIQWEIQFRTALATLTGHNTLPNAPMKNGQTGQNFRRVQTGL